VPWWWPPLPAYPMSSLGDVIGISWPPAPIVSLFPMRQPHGAWWRDRLPRAGVCWPWWPMAKDFDGRFSAAYSRARSKVRFDGMALIAANIGHQVRRSLGWAKATVGLVAADKFHRASPHPSTNLAPARPRLT